MRKTFLFNIDKIKQLIYPTQQESKNKQPKWRFDQRLFENDSRFKIGPDNRNDAKGSKTKHLSLNLKARNAVPQTIRQFKVADSLCVWHLLTGNYSSRCKAMSKSLKETKRLKQW